ncbi:hypothetical protein EIP91_007191 [Steccherinum ochraceum]|uniref:Hydrophobin n=1 Tax=Steccherinum ochraceum TaxID=92696 RepID=A0A4R0RPD6_9APHY|nr:hypothetical protein EIP91_007191 [Steccherinum ochraceum]
MFPRFSLFLATYAAVVSAAPSNSADRRVLGGSLPLAFPASGGRSGSVDLSQCDAGKVQCCESVHPARAPAAAQTLGLLGIVLQNVNVPVGLTCTPISVIHVVGLASACNAQAVCCEDNTYGALGANIGCTPIDLSL